MPLAITNKVKTTIDDNTPNFLENKIIPGSGILVSNVEEQLQITALVGTPQSQVAAYGEMYEDSGGDDITVTVAETFYKWITGVEGLSHLIAVSETNDNMTVETGGGGVYQVTFSVCYRATANDTVHWSIFKNNTKQENVSSETKINNVNVILHQSSNGFIELSEGDIVDLRVTSSTGGTVITVNHVTLAIHRIN